MPNTTVPAAGEAMPKISRRSVLGGVAVIATSSVASAASPIEPKFDLQEWLDTTEPNRVALYHANRLAEVMGVVNPTRSWRFRIDHEHGFALICGDLRAEAGTR